MSRTWTTAIPRPFCAESLATREEVFERRFAEERAAACAEQAKGIAADVKPAEADFGVKPEAEIKAALERAVADRQRTPVFEENRRYISEKIVDPLLESAKREMDRQREYLKRTRTDAYAPAAIRLELEANLAKNVAGRIAKSEGGEIVWGVFPAVVAAAAPEIAEKRALERVTRAVEDVEMPVDAETVRAEIERDRAAHRKASDSEQLFRGVFAAVLAGKAIERTVAEAPETERGEFREFVVAKAAGAAAVLPQAAGAAAILPQAAGGTALGKAIDARVRREMLPRLQAVRSEIAAADAEDLWPALMDGTWFPEPSLADDICARSDYAKTVKRWRSSPELAALAKAAGDRTLLEESDRLADSRVARAFDLARSAINGQNAVLDRVIPGVLGEAKDRKASWFRRTPDFAKIVGMLTAGVEEKWSETRETVLWEGDEKPANAADQHRELFPSVKRRIELVAKTILEEMEKSEATPEEKPPEEPPPEETPPEETPPEEELMMFTISVEKKPDGTLSIKILKGKSAMFERTCPAKAADFRQLTGPLADRLVEILELK